MPCRMSPRRGWRASRATTPRRTGPGSPASACCRKRRRPSTRASHSPAAPAARSMSSTTTCATTAPAASCCASCAMPRSAACASGCWSTTCTWATPASCSARWRPTRRSRCGCSIRCRVRSGALPARLAALAARGRAHQPPDAQQAVHRRQQLLDLGRPQHRRRVLHAGRQDQLHRHGRAGHRAGGARPVRCLRSVLEQRAGPPDRSRSRRRPWPPTNRPCCASTSWCAATRGACPRTSATRWAARPWPRSSTPACSTSPMRAAHVFVDDPEKITPRPLRGALRGQRDAAHAGRAGDGAHQPVHHLAVLRPGRDRARAGAAAGRARRADHRGHQLAGGDRRAAGLCRLRALPQAAAGTGRRALRTEPAAEPALRGAGRVRR